MFAIPNSLRSAAFGLAALLASFSSAGAQTDPLPSWNAGAAKQAIIAFVTETTTEGHPTFIPVAERIATFDQDGTLWTEQPLYSQVIYAFDRVGALVKAKPELAEIEPFKTAASGDMAAISKLGMHDLEKILAATLTGMSVDQFQSEVAAWLVESRDHRWNRPYTELTFQPMQEVLAYFRAHDFKTFIVTGGGQDFVRVFSQATYGIPPEQVVGSIGGVAYSYDSAGKPVLTKEPKLLLNNDKAGKVEGIHMQIGRRPVAAFGNSPGDFEMIEYTKAGDGARLGMLVLHDDADREYAYGPANRLPDSKVGAFPQELYDHAMANGWIVISMKNDWNRVFSFEK